MEKQGKLVENRFNIQLITIPPRYLADVLNINLNPTPGHQHVGIYEIPIIMKHGIRTFYFGLTKIKFVERLKEDKRDISQYQHVTVLARFYFRYLDSHIHFEN